MNPKFRIFSLILVSILSCKEKGSSPKPDFAAPVVGFYAYKEGSYDRLTQITWHIYKLSDSTIALKSFYSVNGYPGLPLIRNDSIPLIKLNTLNEFELSHQNTDPYLPLAPGGYLLEATGKLKGSEMSVVLNYHYPNDVTVTESAKLLRK